MKARSKFLTHDINFSGVKKHFDFFLGNKVLVYSIFRNKKMLKTAGT